MDDVEPLN